MKEFDTPCGKCNPSQRPTGFAIHQRLEQMSKANCVITKEIVRLARLGSNPKIKEIAEKLQIPEDTVVKYSLKSYESLVDESRILEHLNAATETK